MPSIHDELDSFNRYASEHLACGKANLSLDELFMQWHDVQSRDEVNQAIRRGLADVEAGRHRTAEESLDAIRQRFGVSDQ